MKRRFSLFVVIAAGNYIKLTVLYFVDKPVRIVNSAAPVATQIMLQRFGFSYSVKRVTLYILDEQVNAFQSFSVLALPVKVVRPSLVSPEFNYRPLPRQVRAWKPFLH